MTNPVVPGDPYGGIKDPKQGQPPSAFEVNRFHTNSDRDKDQKAVHHSLGIDHNQASSGDHVHDGKSSRQLGFGQGLSISGSRGGNAAVASIIALLSNFIEFDDNTTV